MIASSVDPHCQTSVTMDQLQQWTALSRRSIQRHLRMAEDLGELLVCPGWPALMALPLVPGFVWPGRDPRRDPLGLKRVLGPEAVAR